MSQRWNQLPADSRMHVYKLLMTAAEDLRRGGASPADHRVVAIMLALSVLREASPQPASFAEYVNAHDTIPTPQPATVRGEVLSSRPLSTEPTAHFCGCCGAVVPSRDRVVWVAPGQLLCVRCAESP